jgi:uncharacterized protein (TIGR00299 family) protein
MKKILYFECNAGISGDMTLGALVDLGVPAAEIERELGKLGLDKTQFALVPHQTKKSGITGTNLDVVLKDGHEKGHGHTTYAYIRELIDGSELADDIKHMAKQIFNVIAEAEAAVHRKSVEEVAFHEVGALDSIIDIVGTAVAIYLLQQRENCTFDIRCSSVHDGTGFITCQHGVIPVPVPAVVEMMKTSEISFVYENVDTELVTPTGFGILKGLGAKCTRPPAMKITSAGYGFGKRETGLFSAVRILLGIEA